MKKRNEKGRKEILRSHTNIPDRFVYLLVATSLSTKKEYISFFVRKSINQILNLFKKQQILKFSYFISDYFIIDKLFANRFKYINIEKRRSFFSFIIRIYINELSNHKEFWLM